ncbi:Regulator of G-protein signaling 7, partial [Borealophlyctis nickersoniae]
MARRGSLPANVSAVDLDYTPLPSPERRLRIARVLTKSRTRATTHVNQFFKIAVQIPGGENFDVTVDKDQSVDYLAKQIEAEYAFRFLLGHSAEEGKEGEGEETAQQAPPVKKARPLSIGQVYDAGMLALKFGDKVGDVLAFNDTVHVINTFSDAPSTRDVLSETVEEPVIPNPSLATEPDEAAAGISTKSLPVVQSHREGTPIGQTPLPQSLLSVASHSAFPTLNINKDPALSNSSGLSEVSVSRGRQYSLIVNPTLDDRLQATLHNKMALKHFIEFCVEEYTIENVLFWLDVEIFQSCDAQIRSVYAKYIYLTYIAIDSPLQMNLSDEIRKDVAWPVPANPAEVDVSMFDEVQEQAYAMMKGHSFVRYETSLKMQQYLEARRSDRQRYNQSRISGPYAQHFKPNIEQLLSLTAVLEDPTSKPTTDFLASFSKDGRHIGINSIEFREFVLNHILSSRLSMSGAGGLLSGYFSNTNRHMWAQKQRKMYKEKKLSKFFGQRPSSEQIQKQILGSPKIPHLDLDIMKKIRGGISAMLKPSSSD